MALTVITQETFQGMGTLNAGSPGNLGTVSTGSFIKQAEGPRLSSDSTVNGRGWSADLRLATGSRAAFHIANINSTAAASLGCFSNWYYISAIYYGGAGNYGLFSSTFATDGNELVEVLFLGTSGNNTALGHFYYNVNGIWTTTDSGVAIPLNQWFELRHSWSLTATKTYTYAVQYRLSGSATWVAVYSGTGVVVGNVIKEVHGGQAQNSGSNSYFNGRYGMPTLLSMGTYGSDYQSAVPAQVDPPATPTTWYWNSGGSDSNDGTSSGTAILTAAEVNLRSQYSGFMNRPQPTQPSISAISVASGLATVTATAHGLSTGATVIIQGALPPAVWLNGDFTVTVTDANHFTYTVAAPPPVNGVPTLAATGTQTATGTFTCNVLDYGDTLVMNNTVGGTPVDFATNTLTLSTQGMLLSIVGSPNIWRTLPASGWTQYDSVNYPYIWQSTDSSATDLSTCVIWENGLWLNHPAGANIAAVKSTLNGYGTSGTGGFWTDGTALYLVGTGGGSPNSNGKTYTRSRFKTVPAAIYISGTDIDVVGDGTTTLKGTCLTSTTNTIQPGYVIEVATCAGAVRIKNLTVTYFGSHGIGNAGDSTNFVCWRSNISYGQGQPETWPSFSGTYTQDVDYSNAGSNISAGYTNCMSLSSVGVVGSSAGSTDPNVGSWISHGTGTPFVNIYFLNCGFTGNLGAQGDIAGTVYIQGGTSGGGTLTNTFSVNQHHAMGTLFVPGGLYTGTVTNTVISVTLGAPFSGGLYWQALNGTLVMKGCTIDVRGNSQASGQLSALFGKPAALYSGTNLVVDGTSNTKVTSATHNFTATDVGSVVIISAGTGWTPGAYTINSVNSNAAILSASPAAVSTSGGAWSEFIPSALTMQGCVLLIDSGKDFTLLNGFASTDAIAVDHNAYQLGSASYLVASYNNGAGAANRTFAAWQGYGKDAGSLDTALSFGANYRPVGGSPVAVLSPNSAALGGLPDYLGNFRPGSPYYVDAGAVQASINGRILVNPVNGT
jgi:hypothetical protein